VLSQEQLIPNAADNLRFKKKQPPEPKAEQMEIPLSTEQPAVKLRPGSLSYNPATGRFYAEHATVETPASSAPEAVNQTESAVDPM
ncbi:DNA mismatch repair endonuclease MutL, partial [Enterococcus faecalis]